MWRRARGFRRGFTNHCDSADIIDDMVVGGAGDPPLRPARRRRDAASSSPPRFCGRRDGGWP
jgi:hypothetical protein